jgi:hypothetical protein
MLALPKAIIAALVAISEEADDVRSESKSRLGLYVGFWRKAVIKQSADIR